MYYDRNKKTEPLVKIQNIFWNYGSDQLSIVNKDLNLSLYSIVMV